ncbi:unnamed protein product [Penicillium nalgiovense]|uniref:F5/8 type C domain-containing protein n=2 Tax=Penicillium TaxID=5073 RepID=A0A1V6X134_PENNA|nr:hypothetical protein PENNAL_c0143G01882 [Penicillium nalgiovense]CAG7961205.1 unnamed protein product [Penicillium salamii]CAG7968650.1 unnamed protein product [Penicillium salamii]CAG8187234.1 unnamed protein product [Penicillium nalgiovense]CAG8189484.1 unnamed protein product [Penicillium nalgiovense]
MKLEWHTWVFLLGAARARDIAQLERSYIEGKTPDRTNIHGINVATLSQTPPEGQEIPTDGWTAVCTSASGDHECNKAFDANDSTYWLSESGGDVQSITIHLGDEQKAISGIIVVPVQGGDGSNWIEQHEVSLSTDGEKWERVAYGTWWPDESLKLAAFQPRKAKHVRLSAPTPKGIAIADLSIYEDRYITPDPSNLGAWGPTINFPLVPVSAAVDAHSGEVVAWSAWGYDQFTAGKAGKTQTATWSPTNQSVARRTITDTHHDMFCSGISLDENSKIIVTGGADGGMTSIYNTTVRDWFSGEEMELDRGYLASAILSDGRMFVIGGSWSGGAGGKNGEVYDPKTNEWEMLDEAKVSAMYTKDRRTYRRDNHGWLFGWTDGYTFQAGPSEAMNWYGSSDTGSTKGAGKRTGDQDAMCGNAVMYDNGKILTFGGSPWYEDQNATANANIITIGKPDEQASVISQAGGGMHSARTFHSSVVLPDGSVFVNGGQSFGVPFGQDDVQMTPELFIPDSSKDNGGSWKELQTNTIIRVYHSLSLLLQDGTVFTGGGGLCGNCTSNHFDGQIFTPPYLLNDDGSLRDRPKIEDVSPKSAKAGASVTVTTDGPVDTQASIIRYGSTTHTVNTDQRRIGVELKSAGDNKYTFDIPSEAGQAQPGYYMLFVLKDGVPSHSVNVQVTSA